MIVMTTIILVVTMSFLSFYHNIPLFDVLKFYTAILFFIYMPGYALLKWCHWHDNPVSLTALSLLTGMAVISFIYPLIRIIDQTWLLIFLCTLSLTFFIYNNKAIVKKISQVKNVHIENIWWLGLLICIVILFFLNRSHFYDLIILPDNKGYLLRHYPTTESIYHLGIINAMKSSVAPSFIYFSGYNFSYHFGLHLFAEMLCRYTGISSLLMTYYFLPLFYFTLVISVAAAFFYQLTRNVFFSILFGLSLFAEDFSFIVHFLGLSVNPAEPVVFKTLTWSLFTLNGIIPAIPLLFASLIMLDRFFKENQWRYLCLFSLFVMASFSVKSSMGPQIVGSVLALLLVLFFMKQCKTCWKISVALVISSIFMVVKYISQPPPTEVSRLIEWSPFNSVVLFLQRLGLENYENIIMGQPILWFIFFLLAFLLYVIGSFGVRIVFVKYLFDFIKGKITQPTVILMLIFVVSGFLLSELIFIGSKSNVSDINNGGWFAIQSIYVSGFFIMFLLASIENTIKRRILTFLIIVFSFTGTGSFLFEYRNINKFTTISPNEISLSNFIEQNTLKSAIILEPLKRGPSLVSHLSGRNSTIAIDRTFLPHVASMSVIKERQKDVVNFYEKDYKGDRSKIIKKYNINFFITTDSLNEYIDEELLGEKIFDNGQYLLYKINQ